MTQILHSLLASLIAFNSWALTPRAGFSSQEGGPKTTRSSQTSERPDKEKREKALLKVRELAERAIGFRSTTARVNTLVFFGDLLWEHDRAYALNLYLRAYDEVKSARPQERPDEESRRAGSVLTAGQLSGLRARIITSLARHDAALAKRLSEEYTNFDSSLTDARAAMNALEAGNAQGAIKLAERSLTRDAPGWSLNIVAFLQKLRRKDSVAADKLFLRALDHITTQSQLGVNDLLTIGTYLFTSPFLASAGDQSLKERDGLTLYAEVNNTMVVDITANRPGISPQIVRSYLLAVVGALSRRASAESDPELDLVALRLLVPKAQSFAPDLVGVLSARMQAVVVNSSHALADTSPLSRLETSEATGIEQRLAEAEAIADDGRRDGALFAVAYSLYQSAEYRRARQVAEKINDLPGRQKLLNLIQFGEGARLAELRKITESESIADKLAPGPERAVLWLAIASAHARKGDPVRAYEALNVAIRDCRRLQDERYRPYLLLAAAAEFSDFDISSSLEALKESINSFNASDKSYFQWFLTLEIGGVQREFPLALKGINNNMRPALEKLFKADADATLAAFMGIKNEDLQGEALAAISENILR